MTDRVLVAQLVRYARHHQHPLNRLLHSLTEPLNLALTLLVLHEFQLEGGLSLGVFVFAWLAGFALHVHFVAGGLGLVLVAALAFVLHSSLEPAHFVGLLLGTLVLRQVLGHHFLERNAAAWLTKHEGLTWFQSLWQGFALGIVYWPLNGLFGFGLFPELRAEIDRASTSAS